MHQIVENLLSEVTVGGTVVPFAHMKYTGKSSLYLVYSFLAETPCVCADDVAETSVVEVDVDIYARDRGSFTAAVAAVKNLFIGAGWSWAEDSPEMYDEDTCFIHRTITFEKERSYIWQPSD